MLIAVKCVKSCHQVRDLAELGQHAILKLLFHLHLLRQIEMDVYKFCLYIYIYKYIMHRCICKITDFGNFPDIIYIYIYVCVYLYACGCICAKLIPIPGFSAAFLVVNRKPWYTKIIAKIHPQEGSGPCCLLGPPHLRG